MRGRYASHTPRLGLKQREDRYIKEPRVYVCVCARALNRESDGDGEIQSKQF